MACDSAFQELVNHNPFIKDLEEQGFHIDYIGGYFAIYGLPYLDQNGDLQYGDWISPLDLAGWVIDPPSNHQAWFRGGRPHGQNKMPLRLGGGPQQVVVNEIFTANESFSFKLLGPDGQMRVYASFEEKVVTYLDTITAPAMASFPDATPLRGIEVKAAEQGSSLLYPDTMSARYHLNDISMKLRGKSVAIIGLGGTGSYILDYLAKTHLDRIALFDDDKVHVHTIFRIPGFIEGAIGKKKVEALANSYSHMHAGLEPYDERISEENLNKLDEFDFVFVAIDHAPSRGAIADHLVSLGRPFIDCGMGLTRGIDGLNGMVRVSLPSQSNYSDIKASPYLPVNLAQDDEYKRQPQISEFNALNAALAVMMFKQTMGLYDLIDSTSAIIFESCSFEISQAGVS